MTTKKMEDAETLLEMLGQILDDARYLEGLSYGLPRKGHDEGSVANHILELRQTLDNLHGMLTEEEYLKLLIAVHVHDTFKMAGKRLSEGHMVSLRDPRSHPMMARKFLAEFTDDEPLLALVQWHDEGHALWKQVQANGKFNTLRLDQMLRNIPDLELFLIFTVVDGYTSSKLKDRSPRWFLDAVSDYTHPAEPYRAYRALDLLERELIK